MQPLMAWPSSPIVSEHRGFLNRGPLEHDTFRVKTRSFVDLGEKKDRKDDSMLRLVAHIEPLVEPSRVQLRTHGGRARGFKFVWSGPVHQHHHCGVHRVARPQS